MYLDRWRSWWSVLAATVDDERRPGDVAGGWTGEVGDGAVELVGSADAPQRHSGLEAGPQIIGLDHPAVISLGNIPGHSAFTQISAKRSTVSFRAAAGPLMPALAKTMSTRPWRSTMVSIKAADAPGSLTSQVTASPLCWTGCVHPQCFRYPGGERSTSDAARTLAARAPMPELAP